VSGKRTHGIAAALLLALLAGGCETLGFTKKEPIPPCPPVFVLQDTGTLTRYKPGSGRDITDVEFQAQLVDFRGICDYNKGRTRVDITLDVVFSLTRGPAIRDRKASFAYFVAIPHFHPAPQGKNTFPLSATFVENDSRRRVTDQVRLQIPLTSTQRLDDYTIYMGFQLTPEELQENQRRRGP
jgi:hypothetical protein